ncbi:enoyl-CoA hydratase/isomerase family protein [Nostoc sp. TCL240-02]|uniref:enoyl-CoA hydratase/isomerase family protein n=1 Tax=Nostoc sp. TCL240-02 TaxID=2572090 RepID=UPI00157FA55E|nr:enoyl-CoA hydratase/isomerase family protein [Nostoc sp. TCL240-02]QKQ73735.1 enoyl-CoA hydratase/isomerase family protein [Nostoc sp. TCL240-02]
MELKLKAIEYQIDSGVAHITLSAPEAGNALNGEMLAEFYQALQNAIADPTCRVIVISSIGADFCTGMDFNAIFANGSRPNLAPLQAFRDCLLLIYSSPRPVITCVTGNVTGGGVGIVAASDIVLAEENVLFMLSEVLVGMIPAVITPFLLCRLSSSQVKYLTLSSRGIDGNEAKNWGLVDEIASDGMNDTLNRQIQRLFYSSPEAIAESKQYFDTFIGQDLRHQTEFAMQRLQKWLEQPQITTAIHQFSEGYSPPWFQKYRRNRTNYPK